MSDERTFEEVLEEFVQDAEGHGRPSLEQSLLMEYVYWGHLHLGGRRVVRCSCGQEMTVQSVTSVPGCQSINVKCPKHGAGVFGAPLRYIIWQVEEL